MTNSCCNAGLQNNFNVLISLFDILVPSKVRVESGGVNSVPTSTLRFSRCRNVTWLLRNTIFFGINWKERVKFLHGFKKGVVNSISQIRHRQVI